MFLRLVQAKVDPARSREFGKVYSDEIIPALQGVKGCLYAGLWQSVHNLEEMVSLTLWASQKYVDQYEQSGLYEKLLGKSRPYFLERDEWELHLSEDLRLEYGPVSEGPVVKTYDDPSKSRKAVPEPIHAVCPFFRIVSMLAQPGRIDDFKAVYYNDVLPALREVPGCCFVQLAQSVREPNEFISFTVWKSERDAEAYESTGMFSQLLGMLKPTLSALFQWKMEEGDESGQHTATSEDLLVHGYRIVTGMAFYG
ncbi:MAG: antibiotic biosynthesis monooxygenase [Bacteroidota bacterium]